jgi:cobaltochelatase CobS
MAIIKHGARTTRKGCTSCGSKELYWAHDTSKKTGRVVSQCKECPSLNTLAGFVLIERDGSLHKCSGHVRPSEQSPETGEAGEETPVVAAPVASVPASVDERARLLAQLLDQPAALDETRVRELITQQHAEHTEMLVRRIDERLNEINPVTRIEIKRPDGTVKPLSGTSHKILPAILADVQAGEHVLMVGPAGTGKSTIAEQCAEALGLEYGFISLQPQTTATAILGYMQAAGEYVSTVFRKLYEHGGLFHFDELDNAHPSVLAGLNAALANGQMAFPDGMVKKHPDFKVLASGNTYDRGPDRKYVGRQAIDAATLDRFTIEHVDYDEGLERALCDAVGLPSDTVTRVLQYVRGIRANVDRHNLPVIMGVRASVGVCRLIKAGRPLPKIIEARVRRGLPDDTWSKITSGVGGLVVPPAV